MEGFAKIFDELNERVKLLEKQMRYLINHYNHLSDTVQKVTWDIENLGKDK